MLHPTYPLTRTPIASPRAASQAADPGGGCFGLRGRPLRTGRRAKILHEPTTAGITTMASKLKPVPTAPDAVGYPPAPRGLSRRQKALWSSITRAKPPSWWDAASLPLLAALVGHVETLEQLQVQFAKVGDLASPDALARLQRLSVLRDRESKQVAMLSTRLRLTQQSRYEPRRAYRAASALQAVDAANPFEQLRRARRPA